MVTGGEIYHDGYAPLDSTEIMELDTTGWRVTDPLPSPRVGLRAAVLDNKIFVFGENILCYINIEHLIISYIIFIMTIYLQGGMTDLL